MCLLEMGHQQLRRLHPVFVVQSWPFGRAREGEGGEGGQGIRKLHRVNYMEAVRAVQGMWSNSYSLGAGRGNKTSVCLLRTVLEICLL